MSIVVTNPPRKRRKTRTRSVFSPPVQIALKRVSRPMSRRTRFAASRRNLDKKLIAVSQSPTTTKASTTLFTSTFPCTITGLRWSISVVGNSSASQFGYWAVIQLKDGSTLSNLAFSDGADFYTPEQEVLAFGTIAIGQTDIAGTSAITTMGSTKTMRKYMGGDQLIFVSVGDTATAISVRAVVQFFCKV